MTSVYINAMFDIHGEGFANSFCVLLICTIKLTFISFILEIEFSTKQNNVFGIYWPEIRNVSKFVVEKKCGQLWMLFKK